MAATEDLTCVVCAEPAESAVYLAECFTCRGWFHLNPYSNRPARDCGDAGIGAIEGVETYCANCIEATKRAERAAGSGDARVASMVRAVLGDGMQLPPGAANGPATGPAIAPGQRRSFRRVEDE